MKKLRLFALSTIVVGFSLAGCSKQDPWANVELEKGINLYTHTFDREKHKTIDIKVEGFGSGTSLGIFARDSEPGTAKGAIKRKAVKDDVNLYQFDMEDFKDAGEYNVYLFTKNTEIVQDFEIIKILDEDKNDYGVKATTLTETKIDNYVVSEITIETDHLNELTYSLYWAKDGVRLADYTAIKTVVSKDQTSFTVEFNENMFAPEEANQIEIAVKEGRSSSSYTLISDKMKLTPSNYVANLQVFSDVHIESPYTCTSHNSHFVSNLNHIKNMENPTSAIVFPGDFANSGSKNNYDLFYSFIDDVFETRPTLYPVVGNHELQYYDDYNEGIAQYMESTGMPGAYFTFEVGGFKCFALGSEDTSTHGYMSSTQFEWFKTEMEKLDKNQKIFIFMHQGIYDTVSGTLPHHGWHGFRSQTTNLRNLIKQYPNAFVFSGHSHQSVECEQTSLFGHGQEANYINCGASGYVIDENQENTYGSSGYFVEIYEDYLLLKSRNASENKWNACAQFVVPFEN